MKQCSICSETKPKSEFHVRPDARDGLKSFCRACASFRNRMRYIKNADQLKANQRAWNAKNRDKKKIAARKWYIENPDKVTAAREKWNKENKNKIKARIKRWADNNPDKVREKSKRWRDANPEKAKEIARNGNMKIWCSPAGRLGGIISSAIRRTLRGAKSRRHWEEIIGYSVCQLRAHLEKQFDVNMTWENHGSYWEIDHRIPVSSFMFSSINDIEFKRCWALENLQPLPKSENRKKSNKIIYG